MQCLTPLCMSATQFIDTRRLTHVCDRFAQNRTNTIQAAFFNGDGYE